jgi:hypothetical protein
MNRLLLAACLVGLGFSAESAPAQSYGGYGGYSGGFGGLSNIPRYRSPFGGAVLSPYLNLARGNDATINAAIDYHLGVVPERERRLNESIFSTQIRGLDIRQRELINLANRGEDIIPPVPIAGVPIGSRSSGSYFRQDGTGGNTNRSPRLR